MDLRNRYQMKCVLFDTPSECRGLRKELSDRGIGCEEAIFGAEEENSLRRLLWEIHRKPEECLLLTNSRGHAELANRLRLPCVGTTEGYCELPQVDTLLEAPEETTAEYLELLFCHIRRLPAIVAETERCFLRELTEEDFQPMYRIYQKPQVVRYLEEQMGDRRTEQEKWNAYLRWNYSFFGYGYWGVFEKETGKLIGRAGFRAGSEPLEIGYLLDDTVWGRGLATEVLEVLLCYAKTELDASEVVAKIHRENTASLRAAEKAGMRPAPEERPGEFRIYRIHLPASGMTKTQEGMPA